MEAESFMHRLKREHIYFILIILIIFCVFQYGMQKICGFTLYPDEFGYWASAAAAVGYDWSEVASLGSYYSFGYSVILMPILKIFTNGVTAYRAALGVNMLLMCVSMLLLFDGTGRIFPDITRTKRMFMGGIAVLYPTWIFYMQMTLAEALLMFLFSLIVWLLICFLQKPAIWKMAILALVLMYTYSVHMRTVGVLIACLITLLLWGLTNPSMKRQLLIGMSILAVAGIIVVILKRNVLFTVFSKADGEMLSANDYASQVWKIRQILTLRGFFVLIQEILAKLFYLGMASFGIVYWAMGWCMKEAIRLVRGIIKEKRHIGTTRQWLALFLLMALAGEVLICSIYMHGTKLIDGLVYGRYIEFLMPVLLVVGIAAMLQMRWGIKMVLLTEAVSGILLLPVFSVLKSEGMEGIRGYFIVGISYFLDGHDFNPYSFFLKAWLFGGILLLLTAGIIWIVKKHESASWLLVVIILSEVCLGIWASEHYTYRVNRANFQDLTITEKITENKDEDIRVIYLDEGETAYIDFQQMQMPDIPIHVIKAEEMADAERLGEFIIAGHNSEYHERLEQIYDSRIVGNAYILYFNREN